MPSSALAPRAVAETDAIRTFRADVPESVLVDLRRRIAATRWPDAAAEESEGARLARLRGLVRYWGTGYDWRRAEAKLNALPQFVTRIDGVDIQFVHVRSGHANALPLLMTHGRRGSVFELEKVIAPLTDPTAHGSHEADGFDVVMPSPPGCGFSDTPRGGSWGPERTARAWRELMRRLGYTRYVAHGGGWGAVVSQAMARAAPPGLLGIHVGVAAGARGSVAPSESPAALAAWLDDGRALLPRAGRPAGALTDDELLDNITLHWIANGAAEVRLRQSDDVIIDGVDVELPVAVTVFAGETDGISRERAERAFRNLVYFHRVDHGGRFPAWERPALLARELRAALRPLRQTHPVGPKRSVRMRSGS